MNFSELFRSAIRSLFAHKLRSFLTLLGMVISVSAIVAVVSIISGLTQSIKNELNLYSPDMFQVSRFGMIMGREQWLEALKRPNVTVDDYRRLKNADLPSVAEVGAAAGTGRIVSNGEKKVEGTSIVGVTANLATILNLNVDDGIGRFFSESEEDAGRYVAYIGSDIKDELFGSQDPIGRTILVAGLPFNVIGVMNKKGKSLIGDQGWDTRVWIPFSTYRRNFIRPWSSIEIYLKAKSLDVVEEAKDEVRAFLRALRHTNFRAPDPFGLVSQESAMEMIKTATAASFLFIVAITGVSLFVGGIVIMNIMLVSVAERTQEIGIRRALGARKGDISRQFLLEAALMSGVGGVFGFLLGAGLALSVRGMTGFPAQVTPTIVVMAIGSATFVGLTAGFLPARRAANLIVIDAIRAE
ncbi:MAG: ABC transporter permease [Holophagaceae bacterium]|nr:ABC transporter permease [Holophagaceae bacterium]